LEYTPPAYLVKRKIRGQGLGKAFWGLSSHPQNLREKKRGNMRGFDPRKKRDEKPGFQKEAGLREKID